MGRCRYFASVSVFGFLVGFYKSRFGFRYRFFKISDIGSVFRFFTSTDNVSSEQRIRNDAAAFWTGVATYMNSLNENDNA